MPETNDAIPQPEPQVPPCPRCGLTDRVAAVPAVHLAGRSRTTEAVPAHDDAPVRTVTHQTTTALSAALAPAPTARLAPLGLVGALAALASIGTFVGGAIAGHWFGAPQAAVTQPVQETPTGYWTTGPDGTPMFVTGDLGPLKQFLTPTPEVPAAQHAASGGVPHAGVDRRRLRPPGPKAAAALTTVSGPLDRRDPRSAGRQSHDHDRDPQD